MRRGLAQSDGQCTPSTNEFLHVHGQAFVPHVDAGKFSTLRKHDDDEPPNE